METASWAAIVLVLASIVVPALLQVARWAAMDRVLACLPMPPGHWLMGHLGTLNRPDHHLTMRAWADQLGGIYRMRLGPIQVGQSSVWLAGCVDHKLNRNCVQAVVLTDPVLIAEALGKAGAGLELEKSVETVYSKFNIVRTPAVRPCRPDKTLTR